MICQQHEAYASEGTVPRGRELTLPDVRRIVDDLRESAWFRERFPNVAFIEVGGRDGRRDSVGGWFPEMGAGRIEMADGHLCELVVCHEIAHVLAAARYGSNAHDPCWARVYLETVFQVMGSAAYLALFEAFERDGIDHEPFEGVR